MTDFNERTEESADLWEPAPDDLAYRVCRENITDLLRRHPGQAGLPVPACPGWSVRDVLAHLLEVGEGARASLSGQPAAAPLPGPGAGLKELLEAWTQTGLAIEELLGDREGWHGPLTMDVFAHELDIRQVLGEPAPAGHPAYPGALRVVVGGFSSSVRARRLPALRIEAPGAQWVAGAGDPVVTVRGDRHDLFRSAAGRRTHRQIAELSWSGPCESYLPAFTWGPFHPPAEPVEEAVGAAARSEA
jgi:uncharacterized protein (TIGR03083 family)